METNKLLVLWFSLMIGLVSAGAQAQTDTGRYLVLFRDKANSPFRTTQPEQFLSARAIARRARQAITVTERDLPVNPAYVAQIRQAGAEVLYTSRWLNAALIRTSASTLQRVLALPFVKGLEYGQTIGRARVGASGQTNTAGKFGQVAAEPLPYGFSSAQLNQLGLNQLHERGFRGEGQLVAIMDSGFPNANTVSYLRPLVSENRIVATYDFVANNRNVYDDDSHGLNVLSIMAATADNQLYGGAFKASYLLLRTENAATESPIEEAYWLLGAEMADSTGADVINSSLGYTEFDPDFSAVDHTYSQMDGRTTLVSRAAQWAAESGMVVVVSAGNEGASPWRYISAPSDAVDVLAVAATTTGDVRAAFSSFGPAPDGRVKPDVAAIGQGTILGNSSGRIVSGSGTSFSSPLMASFVTTLWQAYPKLTAREIVGVVRRAGHQALNPDSQLGYGIPNFERASALAERLSYTLASPNPFSDADFVTVPWSDTPTTEPIEARLTDLTGRVLWQQTLPAERALTVSFRQLGLSPGLYLLTLNSNGTRKTVRLMKR
ncbi:S8 family peptidase [Rudanella paleaurantiibacter]|uniref:S8 family peptidase n=1 Tax=Rudanella paleaurantiibacter TaxID=2614655 RepID=UPI001FE8433C|nr:S8 family peptidase [Rudanella paleaurantiibacter]